MLSANARGAILCTAGQVAFGLNDALMKLVMERTSEPHAVVVRGLFVLPLLVGIAVWRRELSALQSISRPDRRALAIRLTGDLACTMAFLRSLQLLPLATASAIILSAPLIVTAGGSIVFGDVVSARQWFILVVGFAGVLIILRPWEDASDAAWHDANGGWQGAVLAVVAVIMVTVRDLGMRSISSALPSSAVALCTAIVIIIGHGALLLVASDEATTALGAREYALLAMCAVLVAGAYFGAILMMRVGEPAVVQPFRYSLLLGSVPATATRRTTHTPRPLSRAL